MAKHPKHSYKTKVEILVTTRVTFEVREILKMKARQAGTTVQELCLLAIEDMITEQDREEYRLSREGNSGFRSCHK